MDILKDVSVYLHLGFEDFFLVRVRQNPSWHEFNRTGTLIIAF